MTGIVIPVRTDSKDANRDLQQIRESIGNIKSTAESAVSKLASFAKALAGIAASGLSVNYIRGVSTEFTNLSNRIALVTGRTSQLLQAQKKLFDITEETRGSLEVTVQTFSTFGKALRGSGASVETLAKATRTVQQSVALSGASAESARAAIIQLGQGISSGLLRGEEFNSVMEQTPRIARAIADSLGLTTGQLRLMANEGKLTSDIVFKGLLSQAEAINKEFSQMAPTLDQGFSQLSMAIKRVVYEIDLGVGISDKMGKVLNNVAKSLLRLSETIGVDAAIFMANFRDVLGSIMVIVRPLAKVFLELGKNILDAIPSAKFTVTFVGAFKEGLRQIDDLFGGFFHSSYVYWKYFITDVFDWDDPITRALKSIQRLDPRSWATGGFDAYTFKRFFSVDTLTKYGQAFKQLGAAIEKQSSSFVVHISDGIRNASYAVRDFTRFLGLIPDTLVTLRLGFTEAFFLNITSLVRGMTGVVRKVWSRRIVQDMLTEPYEQFIHAAQDIAAAMPDAFRKGFDTITKISKRSVVLLHQMWHDFMASNVFWEGIADAIEEWKAFARFIHIIFIADVRSSLSIYERIFNTITDTSYLDKVMAAFKRFLKFIRDTFFKIYNVIFKDTWGKLTGKIIDVSFIGSMLDAINGMLRKSVDILYDNIINPIKKLGSGIKDAFDDIVDYLTNTWEKIIDSSKDFGSKFLNTIRRPFDAVIGYLDKVREKIDTFLIKGLFKAELRDFVANPLGRQNVSANIMGKFAEGFNARQGRRLFENILGITPDLKNRVLYLVDDLFGGILARSLALSVIVESNVRKFARNIINYFKEIYDKVVGHSYWPDMIDGVISHTKRLLRTTKELLGNFKDYIYKAFGKDKKRLELFEDLAHQFGNSVAAAIKVTFLSLAGIVVGALFPAGLLKATLIGVILESVLTSSLLAAERFSTNLFGGSFIAEFGYRVGQIFGYMTKEFFKEIPQLINAALTVGSALTKGFLDQIPIIGAAFNKLFSIMDLAGLSGPAGLIAGIFGGKLIYDALNSMDILGKKTKKFFASFGKLGTAAGNTKVGQLGISLFGSLGPDRIKAAILLIISALGGFEGIFNHSRIAQYATNFGLVGWFVLGERGREGLVDAAKSIIAKVISTMIGAFNSSGFGNRLNQFGLKTFADWGTFVSIVLRKQLDKLADIIVGFTSTAASVGFDFIASALFGKRPSETLTLIAQRFKPIKEFLGRQFDKLGAWLLSSDLISKMWGKTKNVFSGAGIAKDIAEALASVRSKQSGPKAGELWFDLPPGVVAANAAATASAAASAAGNAAAAAASKTNEAVSKVVGERGLIGRMLLGKWGIAAAIGILALFTAGIASAADSAATSANKADNYFTRLSKNIKVWADENTFAATAVAASLALVVAPLFLAASGFIRWASALKIAGISIGAAGGIAISTGALIAVSFVAAGYAIYKLAQSLAGTVPVIQQLNGRWAAAVKGLSEGKTRALGMAGALGILSTALLFSDFSMGEWITTLIVGASVIAQFPGILLKLGGFFAGFGALIKGFIAAVGAGFLLNPITAIIAAIAAAGGFLYLYFFGEGNGLWDSLDIAITKLLRILGLYNSVSKNSERFNKQISPENRNIAGIKVDFDFSKIDASSIGKTELTNMDKVLKRYNEALDKARKELEETGEVSKDTIYTIDKLAEAVKRQILKAEAASIVDVEKTIANFDKLFSFSNGGVLWKISKGFDQVSLNLEYYSKLAGLKFLQNFNPRDSRTRREIQALREAKGTEYNAYAPKNIDPALLRLRSNLFAIPKPGDISDPKLQKEFNEALQKFVISQKERVGFQQPFSFFSLGFAGDPNASKSGQAALSKWEQAKAQNLREYETNLKALNSIAIKVAAYQINEQQAEAFQKRITSITTALEKAGVKINLESLFISDESFERLEDYSEELKSLQDKLKKTKNFVERNAIVQEIQVKIRAAQNVVDSQGRLQDTLSNYLKSLNLDISSETLDNFGQVQLKELENQIIGLNDIVQQLANTNIHNAKDIKFPLALKAGLTEESFNQVTSSFESYRKFVEKVKARIVKQLYDNATGKAKVNLAELVPIAQLTPEDIHRQSAKAVEQIRRLKTQIEIKERLLQGKDPEYEPPSTDAGRDSINREIARQREQLDFMKSSLFENSFNSIFGALTDTGLDLSLADKLRIDPATLRSLRDGAARLDFINKSLARVDSSGTSKAARDQFAKDVDAITQKAFGELFKSRKQNFDAIFSEFQQTGFGDLTADSIFRIQPTTLRDIKSASDELLEILLQLKVGNVDVTSEAFLKKLEEAARKKSANTIKAIEEVKVTSKELVAELNSIGIETALDRLISVSPGVLAAWLKLRQDIKIFEKQLADVEVGTDAWYRKLNELITAQDKAKEANIRAFSIDQELGFVNQQINSLNISAETWYRLSESTRKALVGQADAVRLTIEKLNRDGNKGTEAVSGALQEIIRKTSEARQILYEGLAMGPLVKSILGSIGLQVEDAAAETFASTSANKINAIAEKILGARIALSVKGLTDEQRAALQAWISQWTKEASAEIRANLSRQDTQAFKAGQSFAENVKGSFSAGLKDVLAGKLTIKEFGKKMLDDVAAGVINNLVDGMASALFKPDGLLSTLFGSMGEGVFNLGKNLFGGNGEKDYTVQATRELTSSIKELTDVLRMSLGLGPSNKAEGGSADSDKKSIWGEGFDKLGNIWSDESSTMTDKLSGTFKTVGQMLLGSLNLIGVALAGFAGGSIGKFDWFGAALKIGGAIAGSIQSSFSTSSGSYIDAGTPSYSNIGALGLVYSRGGLRAFRRGGLFSNSIVSSPTLFPFAGGTGLMGEAGPEAIMPLERDAQGRLGVRASGANAQIFNINITGDISRQTRKEVLSMLPSIASGVNAHNKEAGRRN